MTNMTGVNVEKLFFVVLNAKVEVKIRFKTFYLLQNMYLLLSP